MNNPKTNYDTTLLMTPKNNKIFKDLSNENISYDTLTRSDKLKLILSKMQKVIFDKDKNILDQTRLYKEYKSIKALEDYYSNTRLLSCKIGEFNSNLIPIEETNKNYESQDEVDYKKIAECDDLKPRLVIPPELEFNSLLSYIDNELEEINIMKGSSSSSSCSLSKSNSNEDCLPINKKDILNKKNIRRYFYQIEHKIKVELKKMEIKEQLEKTAKQQQINELKNVPLGFQRKKVSRLFPKSNYICESEKNKCLGNKIQNFFEEDKEETVNKQKRFSQLNMKIPSISDINNFKQEYIIETSEGSSEENTQNGKKELPLNGKSSRRPSFIHSSLFSNRKENNK